MACKVNNNAYEIVITPQRKRKREPETPLQPQGLNNAAFCSTPKREAKLLIESFNRFPLKPKIEKPSIISVNNSCLEVKSIAEIVDFKSLEPENPYEIVRKPPKKKKKHDVKEGCFVNLALNLDMPEKRFNPFEVKRPEIIITDKNNCFTNAALNIRTKENNLAVNPFEISRNKIFDHSKDGIENPGLEMPTTLTIAVPFQPTIGCRIDFDNFTPSKLLAEKLVFTPDSCITGKTPNKHFRRSLSIISEETVDIGKELDCYQLELENSINEAKIKKKCFEQRLQDVEEFTEETVEEISYTCSMNKIEQDGNSSPTLLTTVASISTTKVENTTEENVQKNKNTSNSNAENYEDEIDFQAPAPFVRSYRKPCQSKGKSFIQPNINSKNNASEHDGKLKLTDAIRKSFRKLVHPHKSENSSNKLESQEQEGGSFFNTIRQSLRRKHKNEDKENKDIVRTQSNLSKEKPNINKNKANDIKDSLNDVSVLDIQERRVFRSKPKIDCIKSDDVPIERKTAIRSSIRRTSKNMRNQILKSVFHKKVEEYDLKE